MSVYVRWCPDLSIFVFNLREKGYKLFRYMVNNSYLWGIENSFNPIYMFQIRSYGKAELALLYQPFSTPETALKTLYRWIKGCPPLLQELESLHYQPRRHTFLIPEVKAIVKHLGEPWRAFPKTSWCLDENMTVFLFKRGHAYFGWFWLVNWSNGQLKIPPPFL